jgi:hypothetical protein
MINEEFDIPETLFAEATPQNLTLVTTPTPAPMTAPAIPWTDRLVFDVAIGDSIDAIMARYELSEEQIEDLLIHPTFNKAVDDQRRNIVENGIGFKYKSKLLAEEYLESLDGIVRDPSTSAAVRLDAIKSITKWAGYDESAAKGGGSGPSQATRMVIQWADGSGQIAVETTGG